MSPLRVILLILAGCLLLVLLWRLLAVPWLSRGPGGNPVTGLLWWTVRLFCRLRHRASYTGLEHVPDTNEPGGLIVVSNHTGPIDPLLIQSACRFEIRWMMAEDMMSPRLRWLWKRHKMIAVARDGNDLAAAREAIRHVRDGGVVGIFPEGRIVRPHGEIRPFHEGVGLLAARTRVPVLLVWVSGTPEATEMLPGLLSPSRARVKFIGQLQFDTRDPAEITQALREHLAEASGWRLNDEPMPPLQRERSAEVAA